MADIGCDIRKKEIKGSQRDTSLEVLPVQPRKFSTFFEF